MIYVIVPNLSISGGIKVSCQWVRLLLDNGYDATIVNATGVGNTSWLGFDVPVCSYQDVKDEAGSKRLDVWMDCMVQFQTAKLKRYYYAQDCCQPGYADAVYEGRFKIEYLPVLKTCKLITIGHHSRYYYLYNYRIDSKIVTNFVTGPKQNKPLALRPNVIAMIKHRDHFNEDIYKTLTARSNELGYQVKVLEGDNKIILDGFDNSICFVSDVRGRNDGFSYSEGFPMPLAEAMAYGCLTFCRNTNGTNTFLLDKVNGFYYDSVDNLMLQIEDLYKYWVSQDDFRFPQKVSNIAYDTFQLKFNKDNTWLQIKEALEL